MNRLLIIIVGAILSAGCSTTTTLSSKPITQTHNLKPFQTLILRGNVTIELSNGPHTTIVRGYPRDLANYQEKLINEVLYIDSTCSAPSLTIKVMAPTLKHITVANNSSVTATNFNSSHLTIRAKEHGTIALQGFLNIAALYQEGYGRIAINWINSAKLLIESNSPGLITLAGVANHMVAKLTNGAQLNARYLRSKKVTIFTTDSAQADILPLDNLEALALNNSNIFYHKRTPASAIVTRDSGNVLYLGK